MKRFREYALAVVLFAALGAGQATYLDGMLGSGTRSDDSGGGTIGSGTRTGGMSFLDDGGYFGSGH